MLESRGPGDGSIGSQATRGLQMESVIGDRWRPVGQIRPAAALAGQVDPDR